MKSSLTGVNDIFQGDLDLLLDSLRDLLPIILVISFFQLVVPQQPIPNFGLTRAPVMENLKIMGGLY